MENDLKTIEDVLNNEELDPKVKAGIHFMKEWMERTSVNSRLENVFNERKEKMEDNRREYIKKIFDAALLDDERVNVIFMANHYFGDSYDAILEEAKKQNVNQITVFGVGLQNLGYYRKDYLGSFRNPAYALGYYEDEGGHYVRDIWTWYSREKIAESIPDFSNIDHQYKTKIIYSYDDRVMIDDNMRNKYDELIKFYYEKHRKKNPDFWQIVNANLHEALITIIPNDEWAKRLHVKEFVLWGMLNELVPSINSPEYKYELERIDEIKSKLQEMKIKNLCFYTDQGTDFRIGLSNHSRWISEPWIIDTKHKNRMRRYHNFPSYEIYTSPDAFSAEGKIVITKPNNIAKIEKATYQFEKGKVVRCETDNDNWVKKILDENNMLNRIGEIALVANNTPLNKIDGAKNNESIHNMYISKNAKNSLLSTGQFESIVFDENTGCHFALGKAYSEATDLGNIVTDKMMRKNNFNVSSLHYDFVFGNDSVVVEAETQGNQKVLLMDKGIWKI